MTNVSFSLYWREIVESNVSIQFFSVYAFNSFVCICVAYIVNNMQMSGHRL